MRGKIRSIAMVVMSIICIVYVAFMLYDKLAERKRKKNILHGVKNKKKFDDPNTKKTLAREAQYACNPEFRDTMGFGMIALKGGYSSFAARTLKMDVDPQVLLQQVVIDAWNITTTQDAHEVLTQLSLLSTTINIDTDMLYPHDVKAFFISYDKMTPEQKISNETTFAIEEHTNNIPESMKNDAFRYVTEFLGWTYSEMAHVNNLYAWDIERMAGLARQCYHVGLLSEAECYQYLEKAKTLATTHFSDWKAYAISYITGRAICYSDENFYSFIDAIGSLYTHETSIWYETAEIWH